MQTSDILNIFQTIGLIVAIVLTLIQMKKHDDSIKLSVDTTLSSRLDELNSVLLERPELLTGLSRPYLSINDDVSFYNPTMLYAYRHLNFFDDIFLYKKKGFLSNAVWEGHYKTMKKFVHLPYFSGFWKDVRTEYGRDFQAFIDELIGK